MRPLSLLPLFGASSALSTPINETKNANHIFNTVQDSMRQWGSSLHHNGVSFFLARVPTGTQFYHGTSESTPVTGTEWLAFEPEHAMVFARPHGPPRNQPSPPDEEDREGGHGELRKREGFEKLQPPPGPPPRTLENEAGYLHTYATNKDLRLLYVDGMSAAKTDLGTLDSQDSVLFNGSVGDFPHGGEGERARLACELADNEWEGRIDGLLRMEAGFEIILCHFERDLDVVKQGQMGGPRGGPGPMKEHQPGGPRDHEHHDDKEDHRESLEHHGGPGSMKEHQRGGPRDHEHHDDKEAHRESIEHHGGPGSMKEHQRGVPRDHEHHDDKEDHRGSIEHHGGRGPQKDSKMHHGGHDLDRQDEAPGHGPDRPGRPGGPPGPGGPGGPGGPKDDSPRWMRAVIARYQSIGGNRVSLNFDHFVTAYSKDIDLFQGSRLPRLSHLSEQQLSALRDEVTHMIKTYHPAEVCEDWQAVADMIVTRYSKELSYYTSGKIGSLLRLQTEIERLMSPFIDYEKRDTDAEIGRCAMQFVPEGALQDGSLAGRAVHGVAEKICATLHEAQSQKTLKAAVKAIQELVQYLDWATWKECKGCEANEICVIPIWPMGTVEDYEHPKCKDADDAYGEGGKSYWGGFRH
ncbi:unnamed protein product [Penicillium bialowiezense]